jgi:hypothetical protein
VHQEKHVYQSFQEAGTAANSVKENLPKQAESVWFLLHSQPGAQARQQACRKQLLAPQQISSR